MACRPIVEVKMLYKHIFFDLDHTLWDFDKNSSVVLTELFCHYKLDLLNSFSLNQFLKKFYEVNYRLWNLYHSGEIDKEKIRNSRFKIIFEELGASGAMVPQKLADEYLRLCPLQKNVMPFTFDLLDYLHGKYKLHIITNGFEDVQHVKLKSAGLLGYFQTIITSDDCGFIKPDKRMFEYALEKTGALPLESLMIGDSLDVDITGAINAGIAAIHFNPLKLKHIEPHILEISCLSELMEIL
jgi:putative hydrolase of the HAD superfamily